MVFAGYSGFLHSLQLASHELATIGINVTKKQNSNSIYIHCMSHSKRKYRFFGVAPPPNFRIFFSHFDSHFDSHCRFFPKCYLEIVAHYATFPHNSTELHWAA